MQTERETFDPNLTDPNLTDPNLTDPNLTDPNTAHDQRNHQLLQGKRVVICEDEGVTLMQLRRTMAQAGLTVVGAVDNGKNGLEVVLRERPDLVLMDIGMPIMDGLEATRRILEVYHPCIIMITGYPNEKSIARLSMLGIGGYIVKPINSENLMRHIREALTQFYAQ